MERLNSLFNEVRECFFPRWEVKRQWRVVIKDFEVTRLGGFCKSETKTIEISPTIIKNLRLLLIHEICHAVASPSHGKIWGSRFLKAANKAKELGQLTLAREIEKEVEGYRQSPPVTAHYVRCVVADAVMDQPDASFEEIIQWAAENVLLAPDELVRRYPSVKKAFSETKKFMAEEKEARTRLAQLAE